MYLMHAYMDVCVDDYLGQQVIGYIVAVSGVLEWEWEWKWKLYLSTVRGGASTVGGIACSVIIAVQVYT